MASTRPVVDKVAVLKTSVVLGHEEGPHMTTYHSSYILNMPQTLMPSRERHQLPPSEIFHRTEDKFPLTVHQASFGTAPKSVMDQIHQEHKLNVERIKDPQRDWHGNSTEAAHHYQWPSQTYKPEIHRIKFSRRDS